MVTVTGGRSPRLTLWRFTLRALAAVRSECKPFCEWVVLSGTIMEREAVKKAKEQKFTPAWWEGVLIQEVEYVGDIWHMEETSE